MHKTALTCFATAWLTATVLIAASPLILASSPTEAMTASQKTGLPCAACHVGEPPRGRKSRAGALIELTPLGKAYQANGQNLPKDYKKYLE
jgi:hypothetical protein